MRDPRIARLLLCGRIRRAITDWMGLRFRNNEAECAVEVTLVAEVAMLCVPGAGRQCVRQAGNDTVLDAMLQ